MKLYQKKKERPTNWHNTKTEKENNLHNNLCHKQKHEEITRDYGLYFRRFWYSRYPKALKTWTSPCINVKFGLE